MGTLTDTTDRALLNYVTGTSLGGWTPPTTVYCMLLTADPSLTAALPKDPQLSELTELSAPGYSRQVVNWAAATTPAPGGNSQIKNSNILTFGPFTAPTGSGSASTFGALVTVASGTIGEVLATWQWDSPVFSVQNESITVPVGKLTITHQ